ncbi:ATPase family AAA domain-containing protein 1-A [Ophiocordyceps camponoti-floridani]|uniref:ATPase family AAA domain-containing protein 1-A n=1 Tax=Ophiocordyceps camponoti-floridani TaxID=2030778 RepID=A0A8H4Q6K3_9HYPO|nr:ATPase family AAA domain-containing protein 1-A [Ophiocordyceps camponoti-floridani]
MIIDAAYHLVDSLYPCRQAEYTYTTRPFWWWDIYEDPNRKVHHQEFRTLRILNQAVTNVDYSIADALADCPIEALLFLTNAIHNDLHTPPPPPNLDPKAIKRPAPVLVLSGYGGKAIAESIGRQIARRTSANLIQLDAYDLSVLVGDYLGQNWAYSRGSVSMLGFRAAELGGRLTLDSETTGGRQENVEDSDAEPVTSGTRALSAATLEELQKIRQGTSAVFTRWENLKIDKVLEHIIQAADPKDPSESPRRVLIHVHDIVELSMTLEGSLIISKLRALVDSAWQQGVKIAFLGTSSCEQPTEEYESAVREFLVDDLVITRRIQPDRADKKVAPEFNCPAFNLQRADYVAENLDNVRRMLAAMNPGPPSRLTRAGLEVLKRDFLTRQSSDASSRGPILSASEVHYIASTIQQGGLESPRFFSLMARSPLRQKLVQRDQIEEFPKNKTEVIEKVMPDTRQTKKYDEYEKRISVGHIDRKSIKTTFADVHVSAETRSTLKLLTTLALVRPEAFSYGVLAQDRIPGCLLYGPPGTGKTMLAKAVAKESGANMLEISGALINDKWVGESEKLIRAVFSLAKRISPCVVFIDEADALLASRSSFTGSGARREFINQFLKEWDGMEETSAFIMVATNRPLDLDDAVLRRLPRRILVDLPLRDDRAAILRLLLKSETLDSSVSIDEYADRTTYYSGSDLKNVCVAAAMAAVEEENEVAARHEGPDPYVYPERRTLTKAHFEKALGQIPASISEDMASLKQIRRFDREYGDGNMGSRKKTTIGFGDFDKGRASMDEVRVRPSKKP